MPERRLLVVAIGLAALAIVHAWWRAQIARGEAESWLERHGYRVHALQRAWGTGVLADPSLWVGTRRNRVYFFRASVEDRRLGGTGVATLRVLVDLVGTVTDDVGVSWELMPDPFARGRPAPEVGWSDAQLALLRRVAHGEHVFRPGGQSEAAGEPFDLVVEHLLALQRRGLVTCATPIADLRGPGQYAAVMDVALTSEGNAALARADHTP